LSEHRLAVAPATCSGVRILTKDAQASFSGGALKSKTTLLRGLRFYMLPRQDSNLRPIDYTYPNVSKGRGLYHHPWRVEGASPKHLHARLLPL